MPMEDHDEIFKTFDDLWLSLSDAHVKSLKTIGCPWKTIDAHGRPRNQILKTILIHDQVLMMTTEDHGRPSIPMEDFN